MQFYDFIYRDSIIHKLDPRTKLLWVIFLTFIVFAVKSSLVILSIFAFVIICIFLAKLPLRAVWTSSKIFVIGFTIAYIVLFSLLLWNLKQGIAGGLLFSIKFLIIILSTIIFSMSTSPRELVSSLVKLKVPYEIAFMLTLAIRFVPVITKEFNHVIEAQKARAHKIRFSVRHPIESAKTFIPILIPTLMILFKKSLDLSLSIEARAFRASNKRTSPPRLKLKIKDYLAILVLIIGIIIFWNLE
jgi:energy-coupling factor transport system permease protein